MSKLRYGLIGCGRIAPNHIAAVRANSDLIELVAVSDLLPAEMERVLEDYSRADALDSMESTDAVKRYPDYKEMLAQENLDFVAIATESGYHAAIGRDALNAGVHVLIEKPIALSLADARELIELAHAKELRLCSCHQNRFNKSIQKIRESVEEGRFGRLMYGTAHVRWNRGLSYYTQAPWRGTWAEDGGALMNQCIHNIDLLRWMMGDEVSEVFAYTANMNHPFIEAEDLGLALVKFRNGSYGMIEGTTNIYPKNLEETLYIFGENGTVKAGGKSVNVLEEWNFADQLDDPEDVKLRYHENPPSVYGFGHTPLYRDLAEAIREGRPAYVDGEAGYRALELVLGIYKSALSGKAVKFPLDDFSTLDMEGFFHG